MVFHPDLRRLYLSRASSVDSQVRKLPLLCGGSELISCCRIYAVTMGSVPVTTVFGVITFGELVLGIYGTISRSKAGGTVIISEQKRHSHLATVPV